MASEPSKLDTITECLSILDDLNRQVLQYIADIWTTPDDYPEPANEINHVTVFQAVALLPGITLRFWSKDILRYYRNITFWRLMVMCGSRGTADEITEEVELQFGRVPTPDEIKSDADIHRHRQAVLAWAIHKSIESCTSLLRREEALLKQAEATESETDLNSKDQ